MEEGDGEREGEAVCSSPAVCAASGRRLQEVALTSSSSVGAGVAGAGLPSPTAAPTGGLGGLGAGAGAGSAAGVGGGAGSSTARTLPVSVFNNYFSIGADAQASLDFHESRGAPSIFARVCPLRIT